MPNTDPYGLNLVESTFDPQLDRVEAWFRAQDDFRERFKRTLRRSLDEVIDGMRTGRWRVRDLEKTEKTYIGTKVEILIRYEFSLQRGAAMDCTVEEVEVDIKCTVRGSWTIPSEALEQVCLLVMIDDEQAKVSVGLLRISDTLLNPGRNRDGKRTIRAASWRQIRWLLRDEPLRAHLLARLSQKAVDRILLPTGGQERINELLRIVHDVIITRNEIETVARQLDPMKRVRDARKLLAAEGIRVLGHQDADPAEALRLGLPVPKKGEIVATRRT